MKACRSGLKRDKAKYGDNRCRRVQPKKLMTKDQKALVKIFMHKAEILAQFPKYSPAQWTALQDSDDDGPPGTTSELVRRALGRARKMYGHVRPLTRSLAKKLVGLPVYMLWGQSWWDAGQSDRASRLDSLTIIDAEARSGVGVFGGDHILSITGTEGENDYIYYDGNSAMTGSGGDPVFVFVK